ncbi:MAG: c-type cytochrome [Ignavibacteriaceae bacterium]
MRTKIPGIFLSIIFISLIFLQIHCTQNQKEMTENKETHIERGKYLVDLGGCNHCHSPKVMTAEGPVPDTTRLLSGSPDNINSVDFDPKMVAQGKYIVSTGDLTTWFGPWGISHAANLTPDKETGIGNWTAAIFIKALRSGKHIGEGRPILPPMPWQDISRLSDQDLKDVFAYLQSLKAISNKVSDPVTPDDLAKLMAKKN